MAEQDRGAEGSTLTCLHIPDKGPALTALEWNGSLGHFRGAVKKVNRITGSLESHVVQAGYGRQISFMKEDISEPDGFLQQTKIVQTN